MLELKGERVLLHICAAGTRKQMLAELRTEEGLTLLTLVNSWRGLAGAPRSLWNTRLRWGNGTPSGAEGRAQAWYTVFIQSLLWILMSREARPTSRALRTPPGHSSGAGTSCGQPLMSSFPIIRRVLRRQEVGVPEEKKTSASTSTSCVPGWPWDHAGETVDTAKAALAELRLEGKGVRRWPHLSVTWTPREQGTVTGGRNTVFCWVYRGPAVYIQDCDRFQGPSSGGRHISDSREEQITSE